MANRCSQRFPRFQISKRWVACALYLGAVACSDDGDDDGRRGRRHTQLVGDGGVDGAAGGDGENSADSSQNASVQESCDKLSASACRGSLDCVAIDGWPAGDSDPTAEAQEFVACVSAPRGGGDAVTCAIDADGTPYLFPSTLIPPGWIVVESEVCRTSCPSLEEAACAQTPGCFALRARPLRDRAGPLEFVACNRGDGGDGDAETCAGLDASDEASWYWFPSTLIPDGWMIIDDCWPADDAGL